MYFLNFVKILNLDSKNLTILDEISYFLLFCAIHIDRKSRSLTAPCRQNDDHEQKISLAF